MKPVLYTISARTNDPSLPEEVVLPTYSAATERDVVRLVMESAHREGYTGTATDRMSELGWSVIPAYRENGLICSSEDLQAILDLLAIMHADGGHYAATHGIAKAAKDALRPGTPAAKWRADGMPDPHGDLYNCERADLAMGYYTDDELANTVFLHGDRNPTIEGMLAGEITSIMVLTAAKDRIRWLSRKVVELQAKLRPMPDNAETVTVRQLPEATP